MSSATPSQSTAERRAQLEEWIARTQRTQKRLVIVLVLMLAAAIALLAWRRDLGGFALLAVALFAICGFWITAAHLTDWRQRLADLDKPKNQVVGRRAE